VDNWLKGDGRVSKGKKWWVVGLREDGGVELVAFEESLRVGFFLLAFGWVRGVKGVGGD